MDPNGIFSNNNNSAASAPAPAAQPASPSVVQPVGGDIILGGAFSQPAKKSKKPLIITIIILLVVACLGAAAYLLINSGIFGNNDQTVIGIIRDGTEDIELELEDDSELKDAIFAIRISEGGAPDQISDYYTNLNDQSSRASGSISELVKILNYTINYQAVTEDLVATYNTDGYDAAKAKIDSFVYTGEDESLRGFSDIYNAYYASYLEMYHAFAQSDCMADGFVDQACVAESSSGELLERENLNEVYSMMMQSTEILTDIDSTIKDKINASTNGGTNE